jgi:hypothetical protein
MRKAARFILSSLLPPAFGILIACSSLGPPDSPTWTVVPVTDFTAVAGKWEGLMTRHPRPRADDWIRVMIQEDGTYEFASYRTIGVFSGKGRLSLTDGRLTTQSERGTATCTLHRANGQRMLRAVGVTKDGLEYSADLTPAR